MSRDPGPGRRPSPRRSGNRGNVAALVAVALVAAALFWTVSAFQKHNALQNCIDSGRRDCIATPDGSQP
ncbi:MAG TPA: hypothetical protein VH414_04205 [Lichenihabitans sp.]|jgi:ferric-dicitrate binding protein FerR (iron transport regulator)|nr:hypothetical protein [Lichenihabitans sp.]